MRTIKSIPRDVINAFLYDPKSGNLFRKSNSKVIAGTKTKAGYIRIEYHGECYMAHRIAWAVWHGVDSVLQIDHQNRTRSDNSLGNLREATHSQNLCNHHLNTNNASGHMGVYWIKQKGKWKAMATMNGDTKVFGYFTSKIEAAAAAKVGRLKLHGEFAAI